MSGRKSNVVQWIVCERTGRWAAALRIALGGGRPFRIRELRHTADLDGELAERPEAVVALEIRRDNLAELVPWMASFRKRHLDARAIALVDRSVDSHRQEVLDILAEAGAEAIATSPRQLESVIALATRHAEITGKTERNASPLSAAWASLPWQST